MGTDWLCTIERINTLMPHVLQSIVVSVNVSMSMYVFVSVSFARFDLVIDFKKFKIYI